jgi:putative ABC transport system permease protein
MNADMNWKRKLPFWVQAISRKRDLDADMAEEMRSHIELQTQENLDAGMAPDEARYAALREFGWAESIKETCREQRGVLWLEQFVQDVCYGLRTLRKNPGFTAVAAATLALGIGVNTAIFSIISSVLFSPLPFPDPDSLVEINESHCQEPRMAEHGVLVSNYRDWRAASRSFSYMGMYHYNLFSLTEGGQTRSVDGCRCSAEMLPALGVAPLLGRGLLEEDEKAGCVAVVGYDLWRRWFGSETNLTAKTLLVNTQRVEIVGVMPQGFNFPPRAELWMPLSGTGTHSAFNDGGFKIGSVIGRLGPGVSLAQAQSEMDGIARNLGARFPSSSQDCGARVSSLHAEMIARIRPTLPILAAVALFILLIACANLGNLLLSRCLVREKELAIRAAVGAGNGRLVRQLMAESLLLSFMGAAAGLVAVVLSRGVWSAWVGPHWPRFAHIRIDATALWFTLAAAVLTGLLCGMAPAWRVWRADLHERLKQGGQRSASDPSIGWLRSGLVVVQVSLALVLLIGAGLALRSTYYLLHFGLKADPRRVLVVEVSLPKERYSDEAARLGFFEQAIARLNAWPSVEAVGAASFIAFRNGVNVPIVLEDRPEGEDAPARWTMACTVSPGFLDTIGVPLVRGRELNLQDRKGCPNVAVVEETMARRCWPGMDPLGKRFACRQGQGHTSWITVVGVVRDLRPGGLESGRHAGYYVPCQQSANVKTLVVRTAVDPAQMAFRIQSLFREVDRSVPAPKVETLYHLLDDGASGTRLLATLLAVFAGLALVLAGVGIYGVVAYAVTQRTHEFGVRMALGAQKTQVVSLVLKWGARMALAGIALGLVLAWVLTGLMAGLVEGVSPRDAITFMAVPWFLLAFALLGCCIPALRASRADPISVLRNE